MSATRIRAIDLKSWCNKELSPLAWQRITLKVAPVLFDHEIDYDQINNPSPGDLIEGAVLASIFGSIEELYNVTVPVEVFQKS